MFYKKNNNNKEIKKERGKRERKEEKNRIKKREKREKKKEKVFNKCLLNQFFSILGQATFGRDGETTGLPQKKLNKTFKSLLNVYFITQLKVLCNSP